MPRDDLDDTLGAPGGILLARAVVVSQASLAIAGGVVGLLLVISAAGDLGTGFTFGLLLVVAPLFAGPCLLLGAGICVARMDLWARVTVTVVEGVIAIVGTVSLAYDGGVVAALCAASAVVALVGLCMPESLAAFADAERAGPPPAAAPAWAGTGRVEAATTEASPVAADVTWHELVDYWKSLLRGRGSG